MMVLSTLEVVLFGIVAFLVGAVLVYMVFTSLSPEGVVWMKARLAKKPIILVHEATGQLRHVIPSREKSEKILDNYYSVGNYGLKFIPEEETGKSERSNNITVYNAFERDSEFVSVQCAKAINEIREIEPDLNLGGRETDILLFFFGSDLDKITESAPRLVENYPDLLEKAMQLRAQVEKNVMSSGLFTFQNAINFLHPANASSHIKKMESVLEARARRAASLGQNTTMIYAVAAAIVIVAGAVAVVVIKSV